MDGRQRIIFSALLGFVAVFALVRCTPEKGPEPPPKAKEAEPPAHRPAEKKPLPPRPDKKEPAPAKPDPVEREHLELVADGKEEFRSCGTCHCATDPEIAEDEDWVILNETTTCIPAGERSPHVRKAIMAYLRHPETLRPRLMRGDKPESEEDCGDVELTAVAGSAYLKAERESVREGTPVMIRLHWEESEKGRTVKVPLGEYRIINYWLYRTTDDGRQRWMATSTNVDGCANLVVSADMAERFAPEGIPYGTFSAEKIETGFSFTFTITDENGNRMTLSKNGAVIYPEFRILDGEGKEIHRQIFGNT
ncbi:MAG: hypothetical protein ACYTFG_11775 [Planctomycetota bacterium]